MPKIIPKLTESQIKNAKAKSKDYKLYDEGGLRLLVRKTGTKVWQLPYVINGKSNVFTLGHYDPNSRPGFITTAEARRLRDEAKARIKLGLPPSKMIKAAGSETSFEAIAREWHSKNVWDEKHAKAILTTLENDVFPVIGSKEINSITVQNMLAVLQSIESRGALDVAKRVCQRCTAIFDYAILKGVCENNPALGRGKLIAARKTKHRPYLKAYQLPEFLSQLENYQGGKLVQYALKFLLLTFVRPGELRGTLWSEIDLENAVWRIKPDRMKMDRAHIVPLSKQAIKVLMDIKALNKKSDLVFPSSHGHNKPISDVTLLKALQIMGYTGEKKIVPHGFRATASTILNETGRFLPDVIERQLAHIEKNKVRASYNHAEYLEERKRMMQWWADYLMKQFDKADIAKTR